MKIFKKIIDFFLCFLTKNCPYSIKRFLCLMTFILIIYLAVFTNKSYIELLGFCAVLLGINSFDKITWNKFSENKNDVYNNKEL